MAGRSTRFASGLPRADSRRNPVCDGVDCRALAHLLVVQRVHYGVPIDRTLIARLDLCRLVVHAGGGLVDLGALEAALRDGRLGGAGLDVLPEEPPDPAHPLIEAFRRRAPGLDGRLLLTPHIAWFSDPAALICAASRRRRCGTSFRTAACAISAPSARASSPGASKLGAIITGMPSSNW
jgi:hypothetical protein